MEKALKSERGVAIEHLVIEAMARRKWSLREVLALPPVFLRDSPITPFLSTRISWRKGEVFIIDGEVGVLHLEFEKRWLREHHDPMRLASFKNRFACILHLGNFTSLNRYVRFSSAADDVESVCDALCSLLQGLPHDEATLKSAFVSRVLCGAPIDKFGLSAPDKFREFVVFVLDGMRIDGV